MERGEQKMAHMMKMTRGAVGHMCRHYERAKDETGEYIKFGNQDIDKARSGLNYNLAPEREMTQSQFIHQRCSEVRMQNRKDVNVMCSWVITAPKDLDREDLQRFFKTSYKFLEERYGKENTISAYVHMDEVTPHMHYAFVPIVADKKRGGYKVSAKEAITKTDLQRFHGDLDHRMTEVFGRDIGILNQATKEGNKAIEELKRGTATEQLKQELLNVQENINKARGEEQVIKDTLVPLQAEYEAKKAYIQECDKISQISVAIPDYAQVKEKGLIHKQEYITVPKEKWIEKHVAAHEKRYLDYATKELEKGVEKFKKSASGQRMTELEQKINELEKENKSLKHEKNSLKISLGQKDKQIDIMVGKVNKALSILPEDMATKFIREYKAPEPQQRSHDWGWERIE